MNKIVLSTGSNVDPRGEFLRKTIELIQMNIGQILQISSIYESSAWGFTSNVPFLNQAMVVETELTASKVLAKAQSIEESLGRKRNRPVYEKRKIDIDLIFYGNEIIRTSELMIPHPLAAHRNFVLIPLLEIIPDWLHPILKKSVLELYAACPDHLPVILVEECSIAS